MRAAKLQCVVIAVLRIIWEFHSIILHEFINKFKPREQHEKHAVAMRNLGIHLSICLKAQEVQRKRVSTWAVAGPSINAVQ